MLFCIYRILALLHALIESNRLLPTLKEKLPLDLTYECYDLKRSIQSKVAPQLKKADLEFSCHSHVKRVMLVSNASFSCKNCTKHFQFNS